MSSTLELPKEYPVFEANQVLTNAHLNDLVEYLEGHDRASRANLSGIGIVCGLEPSLETRSGNLGLRVTKGVGVTSAGYLLRITEGHYTRRKVFPAAEANKYSAFQGAGTIHELLPQGTSNTQSVDRAFLESRCFVLYLEKEDKPLKDCIGPDCDDKGKERQFRIRVLALTDAAMGRIVREANLELGYEPYMLSGFRKPELVMSRYRHKPEIDSYEEIKTEYIRMTTLAQIQLVPALTALFNTYKHLLDHATNPFVNLTTTLQTHRDQGTTAHDIQYFYDFMKDLLKAYNELAQAGTELSAMCAPKSSLFPRHLMLGKVTAPQDWECHRSDRRHYFIYAHILNDQARKLARFKHYFRRLELMISNYRVPASDIASVDVMPTLGKEGPLGQRVIPYYYDASYEFQKHWDFDKYEECRVGDNRTHIQFHQGILLANRPHPSHVNLDEKGFLRVEGHIGLPYMEVIRALEIKRREDNLPFSIVGIRVSEHQSFLRAYNVTNCGFEDLKSEYLIAREQYVNGLKELAMVGLTPQVIFLGVGAMFLFSVITSQPIVSLPTTPVGFGGYQIDWGSTFEPPSCLKNDPAEWAQFLGSQANFMNRLRELALISKILSGSPYANATTKLTFQVWSNALNNFVSNHVAHKIELIYAQYQFRVKQFVLPGFAELNPGLEHVSGVPVGGTLVLVYDVDAEGLPQNVIADFAVPYQTCCKTVMPCFQKQKTPAGGAGTIAGLGPYEFEMPILTTGPRNISGGSGSEASSGSQPVTWKTPGGRPTMIFFAGGNADYVTEEDLRKMIEPIRTVKNGTIEAVEVNGVMGIRYNPPLNGFTGVDSVSFDVEGDGEMNSIDALIDEASSYLPGDEKFMTSRTRTLLFEVTPVGGGDMEVHHADHGDMVDHGSRFAMFLNRDERSKKAYDSALEFSAKLDVELSGEETRELYETGEMDAKVVASVRPLLKKAHKEISSNRPNNVFEGGSDTDFDDITAGPHMKAGLYTEMYMSHIGNLLEVAGAHRGDIGENSRLYGLFHKEVRSHYKSLFKGTETGERIKSRLAEAAMAQPGKKKFNKLLLEIIK